MKNLLPEFSTKLFEEPNQLVLHDELIKNHPINGLERDISKEEFDEKYLPNINTPEFAFLYCEKYKVKNNSQMETIISKDASSSFFYAYNILKGRFELAEPVIATDPWHALQYAACILFNRFELCEPTIAANPKNAFYYATDVIKGRFELGEPTIATSAFFSYGYAYDILEGRFELGESAIIKDENIKNRYIKLLKSKNIPIPKPFQD